MADDLQMDIPGLVNLDTQLQSLWEKYVHGLRELEAIRAKSVLRLPHSDTRDVTVPGPLVHLTSEKGSLLTEMNKCPTSPPL